MYMLKTFIILVALIALGSASVRPSDMLTYKDPAEFDVLPLSGVSPQVAKDLAAQNNLDDWQPGMAIFTFGKLISEPYWRVQTDDESGIPLYMQDFAKLNHGEI